MRIALYQPDIPQNTGAILRLSACFGIDVEIIGPAGFSLTDKALRRAGMDYIETARMSQHDSFDDFLKTKPGRLILFTTSAEQSYLDFTYSPDDTLLMGRESAGVPQEVHDIADARLAIPIQKNTRSLNVAVSAAIVLSEAMRQTDGFAPLPPAVSAAR